MSEKIKKIWNIITSVLVACVVIFALLFAGVRVFGLHVLTVLLGSMEPEYHTGALIYVKEVDTATLESGDVITFLAAEDTVVTHRIVEIVPDEEDPSVYYFRTKGDANQIEDATLIHYKNVIGTPVFSIPYLGYIASYIQNPPGSYIAISGSAILILLMILPDLIFVEDSTKKKKKDETENSAENKAESDLKSDDEDKADDAAAAVSAIDDTKSIDQ